MSSYKEFKNGELKKDPHFCVSIFTYIHIYTYIYNNLINR